MNLGWVLSESGLSYRVRWKCSSSGWGMLSVWTWNLMWNLGCENPTQTQRTKEDACKYHTNRGPLVLTVPLFCWTWCVSQLRSAGTKGLGQFSFAPFLRNSHLRSVSITLLGDRSALNTPRQQSWDQEEIGFPGYFIPSVQGEYFCWFKPSHSVRFMAIVLLLRTGELWRRVGGTACALLLGTTNACPTVWLSPLWHYYWHYITPLFLPKR